MNHKVRITKRFMDLVIGTSCLVGSMPLMAAIGIGIKLTSRGPMLYRQRRSGMLPGDKSDSIDEFWVYKFRTMVEDAEKNTGAVLADQQDPRITPIGRFLRATRLDELPQFFNVLKGEMSVVGPRPERPELLASLSMAVPFFEERMRLVKPGITGLAQIKLSYTGQLGEDSELARLKHTLVNPFHMKELEGALADDMRIKLLYDMVYSAHLEDFLTFLKTDIGIILKTPAVMFLARTGQ